MNRLLIVEDDKTLLEGLGYILEELEYVVITAQTIKDAFKLIEKENIDLILLDCNLPDGSGYDFCETIRDSFHGKVLILTARNTEVDEIKAFKVGADDYISKPFSTAVLIERIKNLLRKRDSHYLVSNEIEIDMASGRAFLEKKELELTAIEFKMLCYFIENKNQVLTKDMIVQYVWAYDRDSADDNNLFVRINRLRQKIEVNPQKPKRITTIRGMGYIWRED